METPRSNQIPQEPITDINVLLDLLKPERDALNTFFVFRGQTAAYGTPGDQLNPSIFRNSTSRRQAIEREIYTDFYNLVRNHPVARDMRNPWELLCYAQHIGVPTRLLDWTINPLIAAYFAVEDAYINPRTDGMFYMLNVTTYDPREADQHRLGFRGYTLDQLPSDLPFLSHFGAQITAYPHNVNMTGVKLIQPPIIDARIQAQSALFSVSLDSMRAHDREFGDHLIRFEIPREAKATIKTQLYRMGIHAASVYPDANGIGRYLSDRRDREHWATPSAKGMGTNNQRGRDGRERPHREFWNAFIAYLQHNNSFLEPRAVQPQNWIGFPVGRAGFTITALTNTREKYLAVELMIQLPEAKGFFWGLEQHRAAIESELGLKLQWREMPDNQMSVISIYHHGPDASSRDEWPSIFAWFQPKLEAFHRTFAPRVKNLKPVDPAS